MVNSNFYIMVCKTVSTSVERVFHFSVSNGNEVIIYFK